MFRLLRAIRKEISILECEGREFAFVTEVMSERDFAEAAAKIDIIGRIRYKI